LRTTFEPSTTRRRAVAGGKGVERVGQQQSRDGGGGQRREARQGPVHRAQPQQRPADVGGIGAQQLQQRDLVVPGGQVEAHRVTDHEQGAGRQQRGDDEQHPLRQRQPGVEPGPPGGIELDRLDPRLGGKDLRQRRRLAAG